MTVSKMFTDYALKLHAKTAQAAAAVYVPGIQDQSLNSNLASILQRGDGAVYNSFGALRSGAPMATGRTTALKVFLHAVGVEHMLVDSDGTHPGVVMYFQPFALGGTRATAAAVSKTFGRAILVPRRIRAPHQGNADIEFELHGWSADGSTSPVASNESDTIPAAAANPTTNPTWTMGPIVLNGTTISGLTGDVSIDFGPNVEKQSSDSAIYPTFVTLRTMEPSATASSLNADVIATLTEDGKFYDVSDVFIYLRKRAVGGTFVADNVAEHIKFSFGACRVEPVSFQSDPKTVSLKITPWWTKGTPDVAALAVNTASVIA